MAGLGRGFESLIPTEFVDDDFDVTAKEDKKASNLTEVPITEIVRDEDQPRKEFAPERRWPTQLKSMGYCSR